MACKVGQIIARGDRRWLIRSISAAITKPKRANTTIEQCWCRHSRHAAQVVVTCAAASVALWLINSAARCA
jgi:hypothetical protein